MFSHAVCNLITGFLTLQGENIPGGDINTDDILGLCTCIDMLSGNVHKYYTSLWSCNLFVLWVSLLVKQTKSPLHLTEGTFRCFILLLSFEHLWEREKKYTPREILQGIQDNPYWNDVVNYTISWQKHNQQLIWQLFDNLFIWSKCKAYDFLKVQCVILRRIYLQSIAEINMIHELVLCTMLHHHVYIFCRYNSECRFLLKVKENGGILTCTLQRKKIYCNKSHYAVRVLFHCVHLLWKTYVLDWGTIFFIRRPERLSWALQNTLTGENVGGWTAPLWVSVYRWNEKKNPPH